MNVVASLTIQLSGGIQASVVEENIPAGAADGPLEMRAQLQDESTAGKVEGTAGG